MQVAYTDTAGVTYRASVATASRTDLPLLPLDLSGYRGAQRVVQAYGRLRDATGKKKGPNLLCVAYLSEDDRLWLEISVGSEAIRDPIPGMQGELSIVLNGVPLYAGACSCPDETGVALRVGTPFPIFLEHLVSRLCQRIPSFRVTREALQAWCSRVDPDPYWNTHQTGSPRNAFWPLDFVYYVQSGDQRCLDHLSDFVLAQYGFIGRDGQFRPGRPYHLAQDNGEPWRYGVDYRVDPDSSRPAEMFQGRPLIFSEGSDTLGRRAFFPGGLPPTPRNGYDHEHMEVERLFAAAILLRSERARRDLIHLGEALWSQHWGIYHSSRTLGWNLRLYVRLYQVFGSDIYRERIDEILTRAWENRNWKGTSPLPCLQTREHEKGGVPGHTWEATWQVSTVGTAAYEAYQQFVAEEREELATKARRLLLHAAECCRIGWRPREGGMADSYEVFSETEAGSGIPARYHGTQMLGVGMWPTATLALAFAVSNDREILEPALELARYAARTKVSGHFVNGARSWALPFFLDADRILKIPIPP
ncbi:MAG: hypothetical protein AB1486_31520 [Planctomycetota bacterium]